MTARLADRTRLTLPAALVAVALLILPLSSCVNQRNQESSASNSSRIDSGLPLEGIDGLLSFQPLKISKSRNLAAPYPGSLPDITPDGEFILLTFRVRNVSPTVPAIYSTSAQKLVSEDGDVYPASEKASMYLNPLVTHISPGESVIITEAFDVPVGTRIRHMEAHETMLSAGKRLRLPEY